MDEIAKLTKKIDEIEHLLKKPFKSWTDEEIEEHESKYHLRKKEDHLRKKEEQLRELLILKEKQQLNTSSISQNAPSSSSLTTTATRRKFLYNAGPVDSKVNHAIPLDLLPWGKQLIQAVDDNQCILLHGHWQSGKTSALRFIKSRAEESGIPVYYLDMMASTSTLERCLVDNQSFFQFLARRISGHLLEHLPDFYGTDDFCDWVEERNKNTVPPILLIDEYDAFLKVCRDNPRLLKEMNNLVSCNRNTQKTFSSVVCAGTFSIVASQTDYGGDMEVEGVEEIKKHESDDSLDAVVRPFDAVSPWNKALFIETQPFERKVFQDFANDVFQSHHVQVSEDVVDDILETTCGHPGFSICLLIKSVQQAIGQKTLATSDWMNSKRNFYNAELCKTPTMKKMVERVRSSKKIAAVLHILVRDNQINIASKSRLVSFLRAVGIAKLSHQASVITFTSPIIRDCLLQEFYPVHDTVNEVISFQDPTPSNFIQSVLLKALVHIKATEILDPLVTYSKGLAEAAVHAELYRILHSFFRSQDVAILTETRVVSSSDDRRMRCDIWMKSSFAEFGLELKTECDNTYIQKEANPQIVKYASSREPREMLLLNFVMKEANAVTFPINIKPVGWERYQKTAFSVLFVKVLGDVASGLRFCYAQNGDARWSEL